MEDFTDLDHCYECPEEGVVIQPLFVVIPPVEIRTGKFEDCSNICYLNPWSCIYFIFFTSKFQGNMKNMCVLFKERSDEIHLMSGVISGRVMEFYEDFI